MAIESIHMPTTLDPERRQRIQQALAEASLDAFISVAPSSVLLLTSYWPIMGASVAVATRDGGVHLIAPEDEADLARATSGAELTTYSPGQLDAVLDPVEALATPLLNLLRSLGLSHARLGLELGYLVQPASYLTAVHLRSSVANLLREREPGFHLADATALLDRQKAVKTARELDHIRRACAASAAGFAATESAIQPGARENEVAATLHASFERALPDQPATATDAGFHRWSGHFFCMSGPNSVTASAAYARTRTRRMEPADMVMIHANTSGDGYWTDVTRTYTAPGAPTPELHLNMRAAITEATAAALSSIRPGALARDVDAAARQVMQQHGFGKAFVHGTGHGVGFAAANGNALPRIHPGSPDTLETGMTFNIEPAAYLQGTGGMRHCDVVAVTETGVELLTDF